MLSVCFSWQSGKQGATLHKREAGRGVSVHLTDAHTDTQTRGNQYSYPGCFAAPPGGCFVSQQSSSVSLWKVSATPRRIIGNFKHLQIWGPVFLICGCMISSHRSWDLNKICFKSGVPIIENVMIERVSMFFMRYLTFSQIICFFFFA